MFFELQDSFIKFLGEVRVLNKREEILIFRTLHLLWLRSYPILRSAMPLNLIQYYDLDVKSAEHKNGWLSKLLLDRQKVANLDIEGLKLYSKALIYCYSKLVRHNLRLVISIAKKRYLNKGAQFMDLINEGILGLVITVTKFDYTLNFKFSTYCIHWVKQRMYRCTSESIRMIRLPNYTANLFQDLTETMAEDEKLDSEIRKVYYLPKRKVMLENDRQSKDSDSPDLEDSLVDKTELSDYEIFKLKAQRRQITSLLSNLKPLEERIFRLKYGLSHKGMFKTEEIARQIGLEAVRVKRIENSRLRKIKAIFRS